MNILFNFEQQTEDEMQISFFPEDKIISYDIQFHFPEKENSLLKQEKINIRKNHGDKIQYIKSKPHISLASFEVISSRSYKIIEKLKEALNQLTAIKVYFNNYVSFDSNHLIYAKVEPESNFKPILNALASFRKENKFASKNFRIYHEIHATIVMPKENSIYQLLSLEYESKSLCSNFVMDKIMMRKNTAIPKISEIEMIELKQK